MIELPLLCWDLHLVIGCRAIRVRLPEQQRPLQKLPKKLTSCQVCGPLQLRNPALPLVTHHLRFVTQAASVKACLSTARVV